MEHQAHQGHQGHDEAGIDLDAIAHLVVGAGLKVHKALGPGLLESAYEQCLAHEVQRRGLTVRRQVALPVIYEDIRVDAGYRLDLLVAESLVVEVKSVDALSRVHEAQVLTYLKLSGLKLGLLMNFNVDLFKHGVRRFAR